MQHETRARSEFALDSHATIDAVATGSAIGILRNCPSTGEGWEEFPRKELEQSIAERFAKIVAKHPDQLALIDNHRQLTYRQLDEMSNQLAHVILAEFGGAAEPVALLFDHDVSTTVAILGVLKTGKFFVPLDTLQGSERLIQIMSDVEARLLITDTKNSQLANEITGRATAILNVNEIPDGTPRTAILVPIPLDAYAYIIFTSGSTGKPKGVIETHRNVLHFVYLFTNNLRVGRFDRALLTARTSFSGCYQTLFGCILSGARVCLYDIKRSGLESLAEWLDEWEITLWTLTPSVFRGIMAFDQTARSFAKLRILRVGAERVLLDDIETFRRSLPRTTALCLALGTSEVKACSECYVTHDCRLTTVEMPVGFAAEDNEIRILDEHGDIVRSGEVGEIVIRTRYASPGYWKLPELTRERFLADPSGDGSVLYFTGDRGWLDEQGCLYFVERKDRQVKILGHRVELAEIEAALVSLEAVQASAVAFRPETNEQMAQLIAYVVARQGHCLTLSEVRKQIAGLLPDYMIPHKFVFLDSLPVNLNGKIDRRALPDPQPFRPELDTPYVAPRTPIEKRLAAIWSAVLEVDAVGVHDDFLELGGDSLRATQVVARVRSAFGVELPQPALLAAHTLEQMGLVIVQHSAATFDPDQIDRLLVQAEQTDKSATGCLNQSQTTEYAE